jgi:hypothetical protein
VGKATWTEETIFTRIVSVSMRSLAFFLNGLVSVSNLYSSTLFATCQIFDAQLLVS